MKEIQPLLESIYEINEQQSSDIKKLTTSSVDMLRQGILAIYNKGKITRTISESDREILDDLYADYKSEDGNHYIDKRYARMSKWTTIYEEKDED